jgi:hypothetical protein
MNEKRHTWVLYWGGATTMFLTIRPIVSSLSSQPFDSNTKRHVKIGEALECNIMFIWIPIRLNIYIA